MPTGERRIRTGVPPTQLMAAYKALSPAQEKRLNYLGFGMSSLSTVTLLVGGIFVELGTGYLVGAIIILLVGICLIFLPLGVWLITAIPRGVAKVLPASWASKLRAPDRRTAREAVEELLPDDEEIQ